MRKTLSVVLATILLGSISGAYAQLQRTDDFHQNYTLEEVVVLSRHNIRSPLSGPESVLGRLTPHTWYNWSSAPSELSLRGGVLETMMGQYFRLWLESEGLIARNEQPSTTDVRFYANSMQRTIATAQYFSSGMFPVGNVPIEHHYNVGTMDPVFTPQLTTISADYTTRAISQIVNLFGDGSLAGIGQKMAANYALMEQVIDINQSAACLQGDTCHFLTDDTNIILELNKEPRMTGGLKLACSVSDALVLQYYEDGDDSSAAFGHDLTVADWKTIAGVKDWYGDVLFTAPLVAVNVAHPLLEEMLAELRTPSRRFTFLCGHDSNLGSVLAALGLTDYDLPDAIEGKTPIGAKLVIEKWQGNDGNKYVALNLCYQSIPQLRYQPLLTMANPPIVYSVRLDGMTANADGLYPLSDFEARMEERIAQYDELTDDVQSVQSDAVAPVKGTYTILGMPVPAGTSGIVTIENGKATYRTKF